MIFGVTHTDDGEAIKRATVGLKLSIGLPPEQGRNYPQRLDYMIVTVKTGKKGEWEKDIAFTNALAEKYGAPLRELDVVLLSDDPEEVFRTEFAWRTQTQLKCHGDGRDAVRRLSELHPDEQKNISGRPNDWIPIEGCGRTCPELEKHLCKPSGDLYFMFPERPVLGSVATLHTSSWESVRRLSASLYEIKAMVEEHGGSLKGLRLKLVARPYKTSYMEGNTRKTSVQFGFNLEFREADHRKLLPALVRQSLDFNKEIGDVIDVEPLAEDEADATIGPEFHPTPEQQEAQRQAEQPKPAGQPEPSKQAEPQSRRPRVLDKVASQAPAAAQAPPATPKPEPQNGKAKRGPDTAAELLKKMEAAATINQLQLYGEQAKSRDYSDDDRELMRGIYAARLKQLKAAESMGFESAAPAVEPAAPAEPEPPKELVQSQFPTDVI